MSGRAYPVNEPAAGVTTRAPAPLRSIRPVPIEASGLTKRFGPVTAVDDLSLTVRPGLVTGFLGPNGAGKSTTMRMLLGLETPTAGQALIGGRPYPEIRRPLHEVGSLLDAGALHGGRTAWTHLLAIAQSNGMVRSPRDAELTGVLTSAGAAVTAQPDGGRR